MKKRANKVWSILLAITVASGLLPMNAFAKDTYAEGMYVEDAYEKEIYAADVYAGEEITYTVYCTGNPGNGLWQKGATSTETEYVMPIPIPGSAPYYEGHMWTGYWIDKETGNKYKSENGATITLKADRPKVWLYAEWEAVTTECDEKGHDFYYVNAGDTTHAVHCKRFDTCHYQTTYEPCTDNPEGTACVKCGAHKYIVNYVEWNGVSRPSTTYSNDDPFAARILDNIPVCPGGDFAGWSDGSGGLYQPGDYYSLNSGNLTTTLYAVFNHEGACSGDVNATCSSPGICQYCRKSYYDMDNHADTDKDHNCDYGCGASIGAHEDADKDHACDYGCSDVIGAHEDTDKDHACDYGCSDVIGAHEDADKNHACDYGCADPIGAHEDTDKDHACDYGCSDVIGAHEDADKDHACDYGCSDVIGAHEDADKDHACDYGCSEPIGVHEDTDKDHNCDYGCGASIGAHEDADKDHACDYGCSDVIGAHEDTDKDHACDYGCADPIGAHEDADKNHACDYGCVDPIGAHEDIDKDHVCDYGCSDPIGAHEDTDKDHECDICGEILSKCTGGKATCTEKAVCSICGAGYGELVAHTYGDWKHDDKNHWKECSCGDKKDVAAHDFKWVIDKEATTSKAGSKHEECKVCGYKESAVTIPATGTTDQTDTTKPGENTSNTGASTENPKTGDNSDIALWIVLLFVSGGVVGVIAYDRKKKAIR